MSPSLPALIKKIQPDNSKKVIFSDGTGQKPISSSKIYGI
jgi:hypothetical protein